MQVTYRGTRESRRRDFAVNFGGPLLIWSNDLAKRKRIFIVNEGRDSSYLYDLPSVFRHTLRPCACKSRRSSENVHLRVHLSDSTVFSANIRLRNLGSTNAEWMRNQRRDEKRWAIWSTTREALRSYKLRRLLNQRNCRKLGEPPCSVFRRHPLLSYWLFPQKINNVCTLTPTSPNYTKMIRSQIK